MPPGKGIEDIAPDTLYRLGLVRLVKVSPDYPYISKIKKII